jgi:branched-chain amino acid transport system substrate-binding protein
VQTLLYANTCEMAGTFYPPEVIKRLEVFEFDGVGNDATEYRFVGNSPRSTKSTS